MFLQYLIASFASGVFIILAIVLFDMAAADWSHGWLIRILIIIAYSLFAIGIIVPFILVSTL